MDTQTYPPAPYFDPAGLRAELTAEQQAVVDLVDTLIDGKFIKELADPALVWHGSSNQQLHHFDRSQAWWQSATRALPPSSTGDFPCS